MNSFLNLIRNKEDGGPFSRFKSWEYCHLNFREAHNLGRELNENEVDYLALHLSFYLASWGMYRGSSFILQRDYKTHIDIVKRVFKPEYNELWDFDPSNLDDDRLQELASIVKTAYLDIASAYGDIPERYFVDDDGDGAPVSITLITKILMGTFAVSPALDRFFKDGIKCFKKHSGSSEELGCSSHYDTETYFKEVIFNLFKFAKQHREELNCADEATSFTYPLMKKVDMYFWEVGYEYGFYNALVEKEKKLNGTTCFVGKKARKPFEKLVSQIATIFPEINTNGRNDLETIENIKVQLYNRF